MTTANPTALTAKDGALRITWSDGREDVLPFQLLREACPCATCITNRREAETNPPDLLPVISPAEAQPLKLTAVQPMGNYAYAIHFSDGHNTGIYTLDYLRLLGDEAGRIQ